MTREARIWLAAGLLTVLGCVQACTSGGGLLPPEDPSARCLWLIGKAETACAVGEATGQLGTEAKAVCGRLFPPPQPAIEAADAGPLPAIGGAPNGVRSVEGTQ